jgi:Glycosyltransferase family 87
MGLAARLAAPMVVGSRRFPPIWLVVLAAIGGSLLLILATTEWRHLNDEYAYWLAGARLASGQPLYDPAAAPNTPYAYWYPPPLAQVLAPLTSFVSADAFSVAWTVLLLVCLWWLAGRNVIVALALIAFLPVAVELRVRNVHLVLAVLAVLALRRSPLFWIPAAAVKITPVLSVLYLAAAGRWKAVIWVGFAGLAVLLVSYVAAPGAWQTFLEVVGARAGADGGSVFPIPFAVRFALGAVLALVAGRLALRADHGRGQTWHGEALLIVALTLANPTLWITALSLLVAIVPLWRSSSSPSSRSNSAVPPVEARMPV